MEEVLEHPLMQLMIVVLCRAGDLEAILRGDTASAEFFWPAILSEIAERRVNATVTYRLTQNRFWSARGL